MVQAIEIHFNHTKERCFWVFIANLRHCKFTRSSRTRALKRVAPVKSQNLTNNPQLETMRDMVKVSIIHWLFIGTKIGDLE